MCKVFIKSKPNPYPGTAVVRGTAFDEAFSKPTHQDITAPMRAYLQTNNLIPDSYQVFHNSKYCFDCLNDVYI